jgi:hypothetical protein
MGAHMAHKIFVGTIGSLPNRSTDAIQSRLPIEGLARENLRGHLRKSWFLFGQLLFVESRQARISGNRGLLGDRVDLKLQERT